MDVSVMEPMLVEESEHALEDIAAALLSDGAGLAGRMHPIVRASVGTLVRSMNCYYSNLIEGHDTHPRDIDRALANDFSNEPVNGNSSRKPSPTYTSRRSSMRAAIRTCGPRQPPTRAGYTRSSARSCPTSSSGLRIPSPASACRSFPGSSERETCRWAGTSPPPHGELPKFLARFDQAYAPERCPASADSRRWGRRIIAFCGSTPSWTAMGGWHGSCPTPF